MSMIPAFSPGPCNTWRLRVGKRFKCTREDLYEQCSLHITLKMPSSVAVGSRPPSSRLIFSYSSGVRPCCRIVSGENAGVKEVSMGRSFYCRISGRPSDRGWCKGKWSLGHALALLGFLSMKSIVVGTAGHIDHGKTALVKALTGIDADRLEDEKRRGITIDLGFAHMNLPTPDGGILHLGFVDVP